MAHAQSVLVPLLGLALAGCAATPPRLDYYSHRSDAMNGVWQRYGVYAPRDLQPAEALPLVVFLHGAGGGEETFEQRGMAARVDRATAAGTVPRAVIIVPDGGLGMWANWHDQSRRYEDWVTEELMPMVGERYHTAPCPEHCHVMGVSMGGSGALRFAMHRPDRFSTLAAISAPIFDSDEYVDFATNRFYAIFIPTHRIFGPASDVNVRRDDPFLRWRSVGDSGMRHVFLAWAEGDRSFIRESTQRFAVHLDAHGLPHTAMEYEGRHDWRSWSPTLERALATNLATPPRRPGAATRR